MGWVKRKIDEHVCNKPVWNKDIHVGDIWECDHCKSQYRVTGVRRGEWDQRDGWFGGNVDWVHHYDGARGVPMPHWRD